MTIGGMRERITFQKAVYTDDAGGGKSESWPTYDTVWAQVTPIGADEQEDMGRQVNLNRFEVKIRRRTDITADMRIKWQGQLFEITQVGTPITGQTFVTLEMETRQS